MSGDKTEPRWGTLLFAAFLAWVFLLGCTRMWSWDIWWHLKTGQLILERGAVPMTDWFNFVDSDKAWIDLHWGFQLLAVALYSLGGVPALILGRAACLAITAGLGWWAGGSGWPPWAAAAVWIPGAICLFSRALVRPELLSFVFLASFLAVLFHAESRPRLLWWLPLVQLAWVNCHSLFVLGLMVWGIFVTDWGLRRLFPAATWLGPAQDVPTVRRMLTITGLLLLACLVNPYFIDGALFPLVIFRKLSVDYAFYAVHIIELTPPLEMFRRTGFSNPFLVVEAVLWVSTAASFLWAARGRKLSVARLLLFAAFSYLWLKQHRNAALLGVVGCILICRNGADGLAARHIRPRTRVLPSAVAVVLLVGLSVSVVTGEWAGLWGGGGRTFGFREQPHAYIHDAARFAGQPGFPERALVASYGQAGVYVFHNGPERRVFMDGRQEVATRRTRERYESILRRMARVDRSWEEGLRDENGEMPVVILDTRFVRPVIAGMLQTPGWRLVYADRAGVVFVEDPVAERLGLAAADPERMLPDGWDDAP